jgi:uncharacterized protein (DUF433 family)
LTALRTRWQDHRAVHPSICHGQACFADTRIPIAAERVIPSPPAPQAA